MTLVLVIAMIIHQDNQVMLQFVEVVKFNMAVKTVVIVELQAIDQEIHSFSNRRSVFP